MFKWIDRMPPTGMHLNHVNCRELNTWEAMFEDSARREGRGIHYTWVLITDFELSDVSLEKLDIDAKLVYSTYNGLNEPLDRVYAWEHGVVVFQLRYSSNTLDTSFVNITTDSEEEAKRIFDHFQKWKMKEETTNKGRIYVLISTPSGIQYSSIGVAGTELLRDNYDDGVLEDVDYVIEQMNAEDPVGRIVILNGEPGTGKTYLIRSLIDQLPHATFLLVPSDMVGSLTGPQLMTFFVSHMDNFTTPIILVLEDADACLVGRKMDNISLISGLLNISDGIIGNLIDIRVIATTNVEIDDIDEAILRPGRLLKRINIGKLSPEKASRVYENITGDEFVVENPMTLAEVYCKAKQGNPESASLIPKRRIVGFQAPPAGDIPQPLSSGNAGRILRRIARRNRQ